MPDAVITGLASSTEPTVVVRSTGRTVVGMAAAAAAHPWGSRRARPRGADAAVVLLQRPHLQVVARPVGHAVRPRPAGRGRGEQRHLVRLAGGADVGAVGAGTTTRAAS